MAFSSSFLKACEQADIPTKTPLSGRGTCHRTCLESDTQTGGSSAGTPALDAWRLPLHFLASARQNGAQLHHFYRSGQPFTAKNSCVTGLSAKESCKWAENMIWQPIYS